jgi:putative DNA primase/helicase
MMIDIVLAIARRGVPLFPVDPFTKKPYERRPADGSAGGFHRATCDEAQLRTWWRQYSDAMLGMPTGARSRMWVLDVDFDSGRGIDGSQILARLTAEHGPLPPTLTSVTPRGGLQYFFKRNDSIVIPSRVNKLGRGLDTRGDGGYVVLPPSLRGDGMRYRWANRLPRYDAPQWLVDKVTASAVRPSLHYGAPDSRQAYHDRGLVGAVTDDIGRAQHWARAALQSACQRIAASMPGERNDVLNREGFSVFQLVGSNLLDEADVRTRLFDAAVACGLVDDDGVLSVLNTIKSSTAGIRSPRRYQPRNRNR